MLLALALLSLVLVTGSAVLHQGLQRERAREHSLRALVLAQAWLEGPPIPAQGRCPEPWQDYAFRVAVADVSDPGLVQVTVEVEGPAESRARLQALRARWPRELVLSRFDGTRWRLACVRETGGPRRLLPGSGGHDRHPSVSADGSLVLFASDRGGIWEVPWDGSAPARPLAGLPPGACEPACAPQGTRLAFTAPAQEGRPQVFVGDRLRGGWRQLTQGPGAGSPAWSPDGRHLAVVVEGCALEWIDGGTGLGLRLREDTGWIAAPAVSPDGRQLAFLGHQQGNPELYCLDLTSSALHRLTRAPGLDSAPAWSPDGRRLAWEGEFAGQRRVATMNCDGGEARVLSEPEGEPGVREGEPAYRPVCR